MKTTFLNSIILFVTILSLSSCYKDVLCTEGNGNFVTKTLAIPAFTGIEFQEAGTVIITQGPFHSVTASGDENIIDKIKHEVHNGNWEISLGRKCYRDYDLEIHITVPKIDEIHLSGSGNIIVEDLENQDDLNISISGSGDIDLNRLENTTELSMIISGSGEIIAHKDIETLEDIDITISGSGTCKIFPVHTSFADINISGSGNCYVTAENLMDIHISGSGSVYYKGYPQIQSNISGSGNIVNAN